jgi:Zn-dependent M28 family amino/carboxypeptidase
MKKLAFLFLFTLGGIEVYSQYSFAQDKLMQDLKILSSDSLEGRKTGTDGNTKARAYIIDQLKKAGIEPFVTSYEQSFSISESVTGVNVLGVVPGKKKETIVISAHYDHLGIRNNIIYNGADAEEMGLKGSAYFVNTVDLQKENVVLNVNLDMVSRSDKNELYACGTFHYPSFKKSIEKIKVPSGVKLLFGHDDPTTGKNNWTSQSDQYNFHQKKIPFIYFGVEDHIDYHKSGDDFDKINPEFYKNSTETILLAIQALDKDLE